MFGEQLFHLRGRQPLDLLLNQIDDHTVWTGAGVLLVDAHVDDLVGDRLDLVHTVQTVFDAFDIIVHAEVYYLVV